MPHARGRGPGWCSAWVEARSGLVLGVGGAVVRAGARRGWGRLVHWVDVHCASHVPLSLPCPALPCPALTEDVRSGCLDGAVIFSVAMRAVVCRPQVTCAYIGAVGDSFGRRAAIAICLVTAALSPIAVALIPDFECAAPP